MLNNSIRFETHSTTVRRNWGGFSRAAWPSERRDWKRTERDLKEKIKRKAVLNRREVALNSQRNLRTNLWNLNGSQAHRSRFNTLLNLPADQTHGVKLSCSSGHSGEFYRVTILATIQCIFRTVRVPSSLTFEHFLTWPDAPAICRTQLTGPSAFCLCSESVPESVQRSVLRLPRRHKVTICRPNPKVPPAGWTWGW